ncbi:MAG: host attachment protein, partial [Brevundimonas sp.]|nr:host attachment protein [Brevundimonas sp.]
HRPLFVLADGGRARFVERHPETRAYVTVGEVDGAAGLAAARAAARARPSARSVQAATGARTTSGPEDPYRQVKAAFAEEVAAAAVAAACGAGADGLILVAPARTLAPLRAAIGATAPVLDSLAKDLTKSPDAELDRWLEPLERALLRLTPRD